MTAVELKHTLMVFTGELGFPYGDEYPIGGDVYSRELIERLNVLLDDPIPVDTYMSLHRQHFTLITVDGEQEVDGAELLLYSNASQKAYAVYVKLKDHDGYEHGIYYGYAKCCIVDFPGARQPGWWVGTGYIPCHKCAGRSRSEVVRGIEERRLAAAPFPDHQKNPQEDEIGFLEAFAHGKLYLSNYML